jgi:hypothetical protein
LCLNLADRVVVAIAEQHQAHVITADQKIGDFYSSVIWQTENILRSPFILTIIFDLFPINF